jgi:hypothetical protein
VTAIGGASAPAGSLGLTLVRATGQRQVVQAEPRWPTIVPSLADVHLHGRPQPGLPLEVNRWRRANGRHLWRGARRVLLARALKLPHFYGQLWLSVFKGDGQILDLGLASLRVVTTVGVKFICDDFNNNGQDVSTMKFHGFGTGGSAEAVGNTALTTELTTQYAVDSTRPTGSQASATVSNDATYTTVATLSPDSGGTIAITEHGIFSASSAGTLLDRTLFSAVNLVAGSDSLQATYVFTQVAGS